MMTTAVSNILQSMRGLSKRDLRTIRAHTGLVLEGDGAVTADEPLEYDLLQRVMKRHGNSLPPWSRVGKYQNKALGGFAELHQFVDNHLQPVNQTERERGTRILLSLMVDSMVLHGAPRSLKTCIEWLPRVPQVVDEQFPGYVESELLRVVLDVSP